jgi:hypothetical protein
MSLSISVLAFLYAQHLLLLFCLQSLCELQEEIKQLRQENSNLKLLLQQNNIPIPSSYLSPPPSSNTNSVYDRIWKLTQKHLLVSASKFTSSQHTTATSFLSSGIASSTYKLRSLIMSPSCLTSMDDLISPVLTELCTRLLYDAVLPRVSLDSALLCPRSCTSKLVRLVDAFVSLIL